MQAHNTTDSSPTLIRNGGNRRTPDLSGLRYGRLTVLHFAGIFGTNPRRFACFMCQCDCGNRVKVRASLLKENRTRSCGCLKAESARAVARTINLKASGEAAFNAVYTTYQGNARTRGLPFSLTKDEVVSLFGQPCTYCGRGPQNSRTTSVSSGAFVYNGIDRLDNAIGYTPENCVPCCWRCNRAKGNDGMEEFRDWIKHAYEHLFGR